MSLSQQIQFTLTASNPTTAQGAQVGDPTGGGLGKAAILSGSDSQELPNKQTMRLEAVLQGATGGSIDVYVEFTVDGVNWTELVRFPTIAAGAAAKRYTVPFSRTTSSDGIADTSVALAQNTKRDGDFGRNLRLKIVPNATVTTQVVQTVRGYASCG